MTKLHSVLITSATSGATLVTDDLTSSTTYTTPIVSLLSNQDGAHPWTGNTVDFTATGDVLLYLDIHAGE